MIQWSEEDTERVKAAYKEALAIMGRHADEEVLKPAFFMQDGKIPDPDIVIQHLNELAHSHLKNMIFLKEAQHISTKAPNGIEVTQHYAKKRGWFNFTLDVPESIYTPENIEMAKWLAEKMHNETLKARNNGKLNNSNRRKNITWNQVKEAVEIVNSELINNKDKYVGYGKTLIFAMIVGELSIILQAHGKEAIKGPAALNRWIEDTQRKRKDVFDLFSEEAMKIIKNR